MHKFIVRLTNPENAVLMARAMVKAISTDRKEGEWFVFEYGGDGQLPRPIIITGIKRKSCITLTEGYGP